MILFSPCLHVLRIEDSNKAGMDKVLYYYRMTNISIIKSCSDLDNKERFVLYCPSSPKVWSSSYSFNEEEDNVDNDDPESSDS